MRLLSPVAWDGEQTTFNRMYRERRLAAQARGEPFPSYQQATKQLGEAMAQAREHGDVAGINEFWDYVFRVPPKGGQTAARRPLTGRKAFARLDAQTHIGKAAEAAVKPSAQHRPTATPAEADYVDPFFRTAK